MLTRIVWNEHEQAVLLQALIDVLNHKTERKQEISEVSKRLRKEAESRGIENDEKFRNENGISLQMNCLEYAYTGGKSGLHVTRGWYFDTVSKYQNDQDAFAELLKEVRLCQKLPQIINPRFKNGLSILCLKKPLQRLLENWVSWRYC